MRHKLKLVLAGIAEHVLSLNLLSKLDLRSLQSLAQSCKALRTLVTGDAASLRVSSAAA